MNSYYYPNNNLNPDPTLMYTACPYSTYQSFLENNYDKKPTECSKAKLSARNQLIGF